MGSGSRSKHKKKRSQKHSKKKTRSITKDKTKKRRRRNDSVSISDEDSMTDSSVSCHSSDGDCKSKRRARSRDRSDRKDRKKRAKRARSVSESSEDDSPRVKKRKRSKMSKDFVSRKKRHGKKRRRSPSVSSSDERSRSPSCEFSDDSESDFARNEGKERKRKDKGKRREKGKETSASKSKNKSRRRSRSFSPHSLRSESDSYASEDKVLVESNPKRLKSVIVVAHDREEVEIRESTWDGNKAELVFEHDDYPRSNDSNDGVSRREASSLFHDVNSGKLCALDDSNLETATSDVQTSEIPESQSVTREKTEGIVSNKFSLRGNDQPSTETAGSNCDDLAAALRQKALENLLKRQGKLLRNNSVPKKGDGTIEPNNSSSLMIDDVNYATSDVHSPSKSVSKSGKADDVNNIADVPSWTKGKDTCLPKRVSGITRPAELYTAPSGFADGRTKSGLSIPRKEFLGAKNTWRRQVVSQEPSSTSCVDTIGKDSRQKVVPEDRIDHGSSRGCIDSTVSPGKVEGDVSSQPPSDLQNSLIEKTNEVDGGDSQFQQKTMSVMRGGEMVQVSYKVYIPNKPPALARRQLKR